MAHIQLPGTLEAYYQEAGRAGRDGEPSWCVAFHGPGDGALARGFVDGSHPPAAVLGRVHRALLERSDRWGEVRLGSGSLLVLDDPDDLLRGTGDVPDGSQEIRIGLRRTVRPAAALRLRRLALEKLRAVRRYAGSWCCRRRALLAYFGERAPRRCGGCDRCLRRACCWPSTPARIPWNDI